MALRSWFPRFSPLDRAGAERGGGPVKSEVLQYSGERVCIAPMLRCCLYIFSEILFLDFDSRTPDEG